MKVNLHTHTWRCGHASGTDEAYVEAAVARGFDVLGFSDHVPWPYTSGYTHPNVRMDIGRMDEYLASIRALAGQYAERIRILAGFECEFFPAYMSWLGEMAEEKALDYLILGNHYEETDETGMYFGRTTTAEELARYVSLTVKGLESGLFTYLAHPDLFMCRYPSFDENCRAAAKDLCQACLAYGVPMEYNTHRRWQSPEVVRYPHPQFFEIVRRFGVPVVIGLDAHEPQEIWDESQWDQSIRELGEDRLEMPMLRSFGAAGLDREGPRGYAIRANELDVLPKGENGGGR